MPTVVETVADLRQTLDRLTADPAHVAPAPTIVLVPTLGALHAGHLSLVRRAAELGQVVVVSIFVNPLQFGPNEDLDRYPRDLEADLAALEGLADVVFAPSVDEMYPPGQSDVHLAAGAVGALYEGAARPTHFDGMLTVVAKLFNIVQPAIAVFGQKDAQQVFIVSRMVRDLNFPVSIAVAATVREPDGLALSSRNRFLDAGQRAAATALSGGLAAATAAAGQGLEPALDAARAVIAADPAVKLDYLVVVDPETFLPLDPEAGGQAFHGPAVMLVAARLGTTRLIDNERILLP